MTSSLANPKVRDIQGPFHRHSYKFTSLIMLFKINCALDYALYSQFYIFQHQDMPLEHIHWPVMTADVTK